MRRNNFDHFCFLLALLAGGPALVRGEAPQFPPQDLTVRVWSQEQGLPDNSVTAVLQTQDDYLWIGTAGGLARFDGVRFVPVVSASEKSNVVIRVTALGEDAAGGLWIGTQDHGLLRYADGLVRRDESLPNETVNSLAGDAAGNLWLGTPTGLCRLHGGKLTRFTSHDGLPNDFVQRERGAFRHRLDHHARRHVPVQERPDHSVSI